VAAKTARTKKPELYNNFANVPHRTVFELIKLKDAEPEPADGALPKIQKLMSAPILGERKRVLGVVQVSRKGHHPAAAGPDFTSEELDDLERSARRVAILKPEVLLGEPKKPRYQLELQNEQKKKAPRRR
jgi:GAF domain-containing protein